jgi:hypothetical protein
MTDMEIERYLQRERDDGFNPYGSGPEPMERRDA